jgi:hypothetical protein
MASLLTAAELDDLQDLYFEAQGEASILVLTCGRALDNVGQLAGTPASHWTQRAMVTGAIVRRYGQRASETFAMPERMDALFRARYSQAGKVRAGDVLREADGTLWLVFEPQEAANGVPRISAALELIAGRIAPAYLRVAGLRPDGMGGGVTVTAYATIEGTTATLDTSGSPVPLGRAVLGFSSRGNLDPLLITVADDGTSIVFNFPSDTTPALDPDLDWVVFAY